jgi:hypothetical protein
MSLQSAWHKCFTFLPSEPIVVEPVDAALTSDAGLLPLLAVGRAFGMDRPVCRRAR